MEAVLLSTEVKAALECLAGIFLEDVCDEICLEVMGVPGLELVGFVDFDGAINLLLPDDLLCFAQFQLGRAWSTEVG